MLNDFWKRSFAVAGVVVLSLSMGCTRKAEDANVIRMGFTPSESTEKVTANGKVLAELLEKSTGLKYQIYVASDYTALVEALRSGQVQIAWLAPFAYVLAEQKADARVLLKSVRHGQAAQYSAIIVKDSSAYKKVEDLQGKNIAWTDPTSSSGHIMPKSALIAQGIDPDTLFKKQLWGGSHESVVMAVMNGTVDAGATYSDDAPGTTGSWSKYEKSLGAKATKLRAVFVTPPMPSDTVTAAGKFFDSQPEKVAKIKAGIMGLSDSPEGQSALKNLYGIDSLVEAKSEEYEPLRKAAAKIGYSLDAKPAATAPSPGAPAPAPETKKQ